MCNSVKDQHPNLTISQGLEGSCGGVRVLAGQGGDIAGGSANGTAQGNVGAGQSKLLAGDGGGGSRANTCAWEGRAT